jgi:tripartite-type tricarboxylate transporter receptor subunit TctC
LHQGGKVNIIAASTLSRLPQLLAVPTVDESSVKGFSSTTFHSLKIDKAIVVGMQKPAAQAKLKAIFVVASDFDARWAKAEARLWGAVIREATLQLSSRPTSTDPLRQ